MIASLTGRLERAAPGEVVISASGVGYRVHVSVPTFSTLPAQGAECHLRIVTVVRDEEISLYGFALAEEEELFVLLQGVSGVGPRLALKILSGLPAGRLRGALAGGDLGALTAIPGVGKKLAQRLVVELGEKAGATGAVALPTAAEERVEGEALEALEALGYPRKAALTGVRKARDLGAESVEEMVREALRFLAPKR